MSVPIKLAHNATVAKLIDAPESAMLEVQRILSYQISGFEHMGFSTGGWDGRSSFFDYDTGAFPRGFVSIVHSALLKAGHKVHLVRKPLPEPLGPANPKVDEFPEDPRYDYQMQVVDALLRHGQIIAQLATGAGKSRCAKLAIARINRPTLFITTRGVLMYQMGESLTALGKAVGVIGDGEFAPKRGLNVAMVQTIQAHLKEPDSKDPPEKQSDQRIRRERMIELLKLFEFIILEEAHEVSGNSFFEIMAHCTNAHYRLALTATPFMKDSEESNMRLMASSGPVAIRVTEQLLIERGILARPYFKFVKLESTPKGLYKATPWQRAYEVGIVNNDLRNKHIIAESMRGARYGLPVMILVNRKEHGKALQEWLEKVGLRARFIFGEHNQAQRKANLQALGRGEIDVLIGSTILDVGVDVPAVGLVILAGGGKAEVANRQRIGRGLREKRNGMPNVAYIIDFEDRLNTHLSKHAAQRRHIIESTPGFAENIVTDFDYAGCGFVKKVA